MITYDIEIVIKPVLSSLDIQTVAQLAHKIWIQHYVPIIGQEQVDYMLDKFQDAKAIAHQIENGYEYFIMYHENNPCGYMALVPEINEKKLMISKIYIDSQFRGLSLGSQLLDFAIEEARKRGFKCIWLTVNKNNSKSIGWYQKRGFSIKDKIEMDIGNGFIMDDYVMEMLLVY